jgi:DNA-binding transcriptional MerR regulator
MMTSNAHIPQAIRIGSLAKLTACSVPAIRYYEEVGLIPAASRRPSSHRVYDGAAVSLLCFTGIWSALA